MLIGRSTFVFLFAAAPIVSDESLLAGWTVWELVKSKGEDDSRLMDFVVVDTERPGRRLVAVRARESRPGDRCAQPSFPYTFSYYYKYHYIYCDLSSWEVALIVQTHGVICWRMVPNGVPLTRRDRVAARGPWGTYHFRSDGDTCCADATSIVQRLSLAACF